jgi:hypothetical protein
MQRPRGTGLVPRRGMQRRRLRRRRRRHDHCARRFRSIGRWDPRGRYEHHGGRHRPGHRRCSRVRRRGVRRCVLREPGLHRQRLLRHVRPRADAVLRRNRADVRLVRQLAKPDHLRRHDPRLLERSVRPVLTRRGTMHGEQRHPDLQRGRDVGADHDLHGADLRRWGLHRYLRAESDPVQGERGSVVRLRRTVGDCDCLLERLHRRSVQRNVQPGDDPVLGQRSRDL